MIEKAKQLFVTVVNCKDVCGLHITVKHTGKMAGMMSLSTSVLDNLQCAKNREIVGSVCEHCFADVLLRCRKTMRPALKKNLELLTSSVIDFDLLPYLNCLYFRFESFGDLANSTQVINYFNICKKNPDVHFALWTKNPIFVKKAIDAGHEKPENLVIVYSSIMINQEIKLNVIKKLFPFIDKVFTVYDKKYIRENNVSINCGALNCLACNRCYHKNTDAMIHEILK